MRTKILIVLLSMIAVLSMNAAGGWFDSTPSVATPQSASGLTMQSVSLSPVKNGMSLEQYNIAQRYLHDNKIDAMKYVYVIGQNGQVCMNYQILGKITSSGKRLTPRTLVAGPDSSGYGINGGMSVTIGAKTYVTAEVIEDDGTFGDSMPYYFMWTTAGNYIQVIPTGMFLTVVADKQLTPTELVFQNAVVKN
jgi:hypothetical protein